MFDILISSETLQIILHNMAILVIQQILYTQPVPDYAGPSVAHMSTFMKILFCPVFPVLTRFCILSRPKPVLDGQKPTLV